MAPTHTQLRQLIRALLREAGPPTPDEAGLKPDEALGQYAIPRRRMGAGYEQVDEKDTDLERELERALDKHYNGADSGELQKLWPQLVELDAQGLYPRLLRPSGGQAYRVMLLRADRAALFLGLTREEVEAEVGVAKRAPDPPPFRPRQFIASWTVDPDSMIAGSDTQFIRVQPGYAAVLLSAPIVRGSFLINPREFTSNWGIAHHFAYEAEVISGGPVKLTSAAWMWFGGDPDAESPSSAYEDWSARVQEFDTVLRSSLLILERDVGKGSLLAAVIKVGSVDDARKGELLALRTFMRNARSALLELTQSIKSLWDGGEAMHGFVIEELQKKGAGLSKLTMGAAQATKDTSSEGDRFKAWAEPLAAERGREWLLGVAQEVEQDLRQSITMQFISEKLLPDGQAGYTGPKTPGRILNDLIIALDE